jgi:hypothetical protein
MWTAPTVPRREPDLVADERTSLVQWLDYHRSTLLTKCAGLTAEQLKRQAVPPSRLSLLGLVRHMVEVERWWLRMHAKGEDLAFVYDPDGVGLDFEQIDDADAPADLAAFERECDAARAAVIRTVARRRRAQQGPPPRARARHPLDLRAHDRGVRAARRARRPPPRDHRRHHRRLSASPERAQISRARLQNGTPEPRPERSGGGVRSARTGQLCGASGYHRSPAPVHR